MHRATPCPQLLNCLCTPTLISSLRCIGTAMPRCRMSSIVTSARRAGPDWRVSTAPCGGFTPRMPPALARARSWLCHSSAGKLTSEAPAGGSPGTPSRCKPCAYPLRCACAAQRPHDDCVSCTCLCIHPTCTVTMRRQLHDGPLCAVPCPTAAYLLLPVTSGRGLVGIGHAGPFTCFQVPSTELCCYC